MGKPNCDNRQFIDRTSSPPPSILSPPPTDSDMNWHSTLSQSDPSIQSHQNQFPNRVPPTGFNSASYKVSIGHETVNITELARHREPSPDPTTTIASTERRRIVTTQKGANILSLCFMCFVSASLILIAMSAMHLLIKTNYNYNNNNMIPFFLQSVNITPGFLYMFSTSNPLSHSVSHLIVPVYDHTIRDLATVICLLIIVLNCFSLLVFSIEIYLGCNIVITKHHSYQNIRVLFSSSNSRFIAICGFYASIPALILVMCLFILLNMSLIPAIISLIILGLGLIFILITLLTYFSTMKNNNFSSINGMNSSMYHTIASNPLNDDDIDLAKADELSTLV
ncbi:unnamed protein product [Adineta steineri]|uniref:Uncharacterized protein n=1 Tax=Adineta steineri TaxID=433720 RepID=A0A814A2R4_9BILA|nr:unnamed protein product [Adineta steineri]CAF3709903.1 unnamed protein product [Adineta steineri]